MISLEQSYANHAGTSVLVPGGGAGNNGQCAQWADVVINEVYGLPYIYTPNALDWWNKADQLGLTKNFDKIDAGQPIKKGDYIIYDSRVGNSAGHIDVAAQDGSPKDFTAYDSNWGGTAFYKNGYPILHTVRHNDVYNNYVVGYLRRKGNVQKMNTISREAYTQMADAVGTELGNNFDYNPDRSADALAQLLDSQAPIITQDLESKVADTLTGVKNYIDWSKYNSPYVGKKIAKAGMPMVFDWASKPKAGAKVLPPGQYQVN